VVWEAARSEGKKLLKFNHWPNPVNRIVDIEVLICNQDTWLARIELAAATAADFFWTNLLPSPRELERKALLGGYRCGFYMNIKVKSPIAIIFGRGTSTVIAEIASPFAKALFWFWAQSSAYEAMIQWQTVLYPELFCVPDVGVLLDKHATAPIGQGHITGTTAFPTHQYDPFHISLPFEEGCTLPAGNAKVTCAWIFQPGATGISNVKTGWTVNGVITELRDLDGGSVGTEPHEVRQIELPNFGGGVIQPYFEADSGPRVIPATVTTTVFVADSDGF